MVDPERWVYGPFGDVWAASDVELVDGRWRERCPKPRIVLSIARSGLDVEERAAIGQLAAAAPDMLIALRTIALHAQSLDAQGIREIADAAIARAESSNG